MQDVDFVDDDDDLLAPIADLFQESALALGERPVGRGDEEHQIGARHEAGRDEFVFANDGIRPGRIDDTHLAEQFDRGGEGM